MEATWWNVAKINSAAEDAISKGDFERYKILMVIRERLIEQLKADGKYDLFG